MAFTVTPLSPSETAALPRMVPGLAAARADAGLWLAEVQGNRCVVDGTCFIVQKGETPVGYLLGLARHGHATCTALEVDAGAPHTAVWRLVYAFMERLNGLAVTSADFCLSERVPAARHLLEQLGATTISTRTDRRFGTGTRDVLQLAVSSARFQGLSFAGRCDVPAKVPAVPTPVEPGVGSHGGNPSLHRTP